MAKLDNDKHEAFCREYIIDLNQTQAYMRAYPDSNYAAAGVNACKLLENAKIQDRLAELKEKAAKKAEITHQDLIDELKTMAFSDVTTFMGEDWSIKGNQDLTKAQRKAIAAVEITEQTGEFGSRKTVKFRLHPKLDAIEKLAKHLGFYEKDNSQQKLFQVVVNSNEEAKKLSEI